MAFRLFRGSSNQNVKEETVRYDTIVKGIQDIYKKTLLPLEEDFQFVPHVYPRITDGDIAARPAILVLGQYSTGKTTLIRHLMGTDYPGIRIGPEPTTDRFIGIDAVGSCGSPRTEVTTVIPGHVCVMDTKLPYTDLARMGDAFLSKFEYCICSSCALRDVCFVDSPGVLSNTTHYERGYNFEAVVQWFAERVDIILLMFDAHKLDISDELRSVMTAIEGFEQKLRIVLNKADSISPQQLMRVFGALNWSLSKVITTPEVPRVFIGSFWDQPLLYADQRTVFESEENDLRQEITDLPLTTSLRKINELVKRTRRLRSHCYLMQAIRKQMPFFGKSTKKKTILQNLPALVSDVVSQKSDIGLRATDFLPMETLRVAFADIDFVTIPKLDQRRLTALESVLTTAVPRLMELLPQEQQAWMLKAVENGGSPFVGIGSKQSGMSSWTEAKYYESIPNPLNYVNEFTALHPDEHGRISGQQAKSFLLQSSGLPSSLLHRIWNLADTTHDGYLDLYEYTLVKHFIAMKGEGLILPPELPPVILQAVKQYQSAAPQRYNEATHPALLPTPTTDAAREMYPKQTYTDNPRTPLLQSPELLFTDTFGEAACHPGLDIMLESEIDNVDKSPFRE